MSRFNPLGFPRRIRSAFRRARATPQPNPFTQMGRRPQTFGARVKKIINRSKELKFVETDTSTNTPIGGTGLVILISGIAEGDTSLTRDGEVAEIASIELKVKLQGDADAIAGSENRIILVRAVKNIEGVLPSIDEVLATDSTFSFPDQDSRGDFKIYLDRTVLQQSPNVATHTRISYFEYYKRFKTPLKITFDGANATIADAERGHWFIILLTNVGTGLQPTFRVASRIRFIDK